MSFSVLMSVYKGENPNYLKQALDSIIEQSLQPDEIILIEDGPLTKELYQVITTYKKYYPIIKTYQFKENVMLGRALAKGVQLCSNNIIARMDTDDIALPNRFELEYQYLVAHPEISVIGGGIQEFNDNNTLCARKYMPSIEKDIKIYIKYRNPLNHMTVMFRKEDVLHSGNYRHFPLLEDYDLWNRMLAKGYKFYNLSDVLVRARTNQNRYNKRGGLKYCVTFIKLRYMQYRLGVLNKLELIKSLIGTMIMTLTPNWSRQIAYQFFLRK